MAERLLTINLRKYLVDVPRTKRFRKAPPYVRERVAHYMKLNVENVRIDKALAHDIVAKYAKSMLPLRLSVNIDKDVATVKAFMPQAQQPVASPKAKPDQKAKPAANEAQKGASRTNDVQKKQAKA